MKIQKENIEFEKGKSFQAFSPSLKNCFFWHYHPEIELVYVEAPTESGMSARIFQVLQTVIFY
jgi:hypothetical protein